MGKIRRAAPHPLLLAALGIWLFGAGGCALLPFALTGASFAMPQTASLTMSGVRGAYETASLAGDERSLDTILHDNMLSLKSKSALIATDGADDVHVYAYNGDVFAVGVVASEADRDRIIRTLSGVKGVAHVKGHIRLKDPDDPGMAMADSALTNRVRLELARYLFHENADVDVQAVQGDVCLMGVVGTYADALDLIQYVETTTGAQALSLLAIREETLRGRPQTNRLYLLRPDAPEGPAGPLALDDDPPLPTAPAPCVAKFRPVPLRALCASAAPAARSAGVPSYDVRSDPAEGARLRVRNRLEALAKRERSSEARAELLALAEAVVRDRDLSIRDRLSVAAAQAQNRRARAGIRSLLARY